MITNLILKNGEHIGYRIETPLGVFDTDNLSSSVKIDNTDILVKCKDGLLRTKYELSNNISVEDISNNTDMLLYVKALLGIKVGFDMYTGDTLVNIDMYRNFNKRLCMKEILDFTGNTCTNMLILFGVRRTGKTVLMFQTMFELIEKGVSPSKIVYMSLHKNELSSDNLYGIMHNLQKRGVEYLFVDEITYCSGDLNFLTHFTDMQDSCKVILAGTDSVGFLPLINGILYDRADMIHTTYISYHEFSTLYKNATIDDFMEVGGLLRSSKEYERMHDFKFDDYKNFGVDYIGTSIVNNIFNCFEKFDLSNDYYELNELYFTKRSKLRTLVFKLLQRYTERFSIKILRDILKSSDVGNLRNILNKRTPDNKDNINLFCDELFNNVKSSLSLLDFSDFTESQRDELRDLLKNMDCLFSIPELGSEIILPIAVRFGCTCEVVSQVYKNYDVLCSKSGIDFSIDNLKEILLNNVKGSLMETIVYTDLKKNNYGISKYRENNTGVEVDLILGNNLYEIKHSSKIVLEQCKWLVHPRVISRYRPKSLNVLYTGETIKIETSVKEIYQSIIDSRPSVSSEILEVYSTATDDKISINYINTSEFLINMCK